ncbi:MAG: FtsX-like permease family protein [Acidobacteria bacterium]|nr:FtsX-like permease family protein [Acidobacteriota bacterium]
MKIKDLIVTANRNLLRNKLRTALTVMAVFVGAFTLTMTNGLGDGLKDYIETQVKNYEGNNVIFIHKKIELPEGQSKNEPAEYKEQKENEQEFDPNSFAVGLDQIDRLARDFPEVKSVSPDFQIRSEYITLDDGKKYQVQLNALARGVTQKLEAGRQIDGDNQIVLQNDIAKVFSADFQGLIGREVTIGFKGGNPPAMQTLRLTVVGVATKGFMASAFSAIDAATERKIYELQRAGSPDYGRLTTFSFEVAGNDPQVVESVKQRLDKKGFTGETIVDQSKRTYNAIGVFQIGMNMFAFVALLAASFGIINTLVIAVMERTKEIGLQKALGMGQAKVFFLFSLESILIGFWGAVSGIAGAILVGKIGNAWASKYFLESFEGYSLFAFKPAALLTIVAIICLIAFLAGVLPAFRASRLNPIEALRYE